MLAFRLLVVAVFLLAINSQAQVANAFSSGQSVATVTMTGAASWHYGSDQQTGTVTLQANANGQSQMQLNLTKGTRTELQGIFGNGQQCTWTGFDGVQHDTALHNCWASTIWFLPQITMQAGSSAASFVTSSVNGTSVHLERLPIQTKYAQTAALFQRVSRAGVTLDATTGLPVALAYNAHPDDDAMTDIPVEIHYSDYHQVSGVQLPFTIQKFVNHGLVLELKISSASVTLGQ